MKVQRLTVYLIIFLAFLVSGFVIGRKVSIAAQQTLDPEKPSLQPAANYQYLGNLNYPIPSLDSLRGDQEKSVSLEQSSASSEPAPAQQNILVIGVDQLDSPRPRLISVWLIMYFTDSMHLTLMPIYPALDADEATAVKDNTTIQQVFELGSDHKPSTKFLTALNDNHYWWNGFFVIDASVLTKLIDSFGSQAASLSNNQQHVDVNSTLQLILKNKKEALNSQTKLLQNLCESASQKPDLPEFSTLYSSVAAHIVTDLDVQQMVKDWQTRLGKSGPLTCEFPFLNPQ